MLGPEAKRWPLPFATALAACLGCGGARPPPAPAAASPTPAPAVAAPAEPVPTALPFAPPPPLLVRGVGFKQPSCVLHDAALDVYLVSNVNGEPDARDGNGFISRVGPEGELLELSWIQGGAGGVALDAPRGMAIAGDKLYIADIDTVRVFERTTGKAAGKLTLPPAFFVSDVAAAPAGDVLYVAERGGAKPGRSSKKAVPPALYAFDGGGGSSARTLASGAALGEPAALVADDAGVWLVAAGGTLQRVLRDGKSEVTLELAQKGLTGVVRTRSDRLLVASRDASAVLLGKAEGGFEPFATDLAAPGDIGYDERRSKLLVPLTADDAVYVQPVPGE
jgi:hypothetical protein